MSMMLQGSFDRRSRRLLKKSKLLKRDRVYSISDDGLIVRRRRRRVFSLPIADALKLAAAFLVFKVIAVLNLGLGDYTGRINALTEGNPIDRIAAIFLQADPVTVALARHALALDDLLRVIERATLF